MDGINEMMGFHILPIDEKRSKTMSNKILSEMAPAESMGYAFLA